MLIDRQRRRTANWYMIIHLAISCTLILPFACAVIALVFVKKRSFFWSINFKIVRESFCHIVQTTCSNTLCVIDRSYWVACMHLYHYIYQNNCCFRHINSYILQQVISNMILTFALFVVSWNVSIQYAKIHDVYSYNKMLTLLQCVCVLIYACLKRYKNKYFLICICRCAKMILKW